MTEHAELYYPANPPAYSTTKFSDKGYIYTSEGLGELDFAVTGIISKSEHPRCGTPSAIGILDAYAGVARNITVKELEVEYIRQGSRVTEALEAVTGIAPIRTLFISDDFGGDLPGGLTIYGVEVVTNLREALYVGIASRMHIKEDFIFRKWVKLTWPGVLARPIVSGREFRILLYTTGAGSFTIKSLRAWVKLTDRRGFNTSPQGVKGIGATDDSQGSSNTGQ